MKLLKSLLQYAESVPLPQTARQFFGLYHPLLNGSFTLEQLASTSTLHPSLSTLQVRMHDVDARPYQLTYRHLSPIDNVPDSERYSSNLEFRSIGPYSQVTPLTNENEYGRLAAKVKDVVKSRLAGHVKIHDIKKVGQDWTQVMTFFESVGLRELVALVARLPDDNTDKQRIKLVYVNVPTSVYWNALERELPLEKQPK